MTGQTAYPQNELDASSGLTVYNQFHDVLPGASIMSGWNRLDNKRLLAQDVLISRIHAKHESILVFNLAWFRGGLIELPWPEALAGKT
jgi:hypothetical protein